MRELIPLLTHSLKLLVVAGACLLAAHGDTTLTVGGAPIDQIPFPFGDGISDSEFQQIYDGSLFAGISGPVSIDSLTFQDTFNMFSPDTLDQAQYTISLFETSQTVDSFLSTSNSTGLQVIANATTVFSMSQPGCPFLGVDSTTCDLATSPQTFTINFSQTFKYDPTAGNLLLDIFKTSGSGALSAGFDVSNYTGCLLAGCTPPPGTALIGAAFSDLSSQCTADCAIPEGLVTTFGFAPSSTPAVPEPGSLPTGVFGLGFMILYAIPQSDRTRKS